MADSPAGPRPARSAARALKKIRLALTLGLVVLVLIVLFQNVDQVAPVSMLFWSPEVPLYLPMLVSFGAGVIVGVVVLHLLRRRGK